jgi:hypothetical protein
LPRPFADARRAGARGVLPGVVPMNGCERFAVAVRGVRFVGGECVDGAAAFAVRRLSDDHADAMRPIADAARVGAQLAATSKRR